MTNNTSGIDIRKALLASNLNPNKFDEGPLLAYVRENDIEVEDISTLAQDHFNKDSTLNKPADYDLYN